MIRFSTVVSISSIFYIFFLVSIKKHISLFIVLARDVDNMLSMSLFDDFHYCVQNSNIDIRATVSSDSSCHLDGSNIFFLAHARRMVEHIILLTTLVIIVLLFGFCLLEINPEQIIRNRVLRYLFLFINRLSASVHIY
jgi:hypothetical protein